MKPPTAADAPFPEAPGANTSKAAAALDLANLKICEARELLDAVLAQTQSHRLMLVIDKAVELVDSLLADIARVRPLLNARSGMDVMTDYRGLIKRIAPEADARLIEAWMRVKCHGKLDHLSADRFRHEVQLAAACVAEATPEQSEALAQSFGL